MHIKSITPPKMPFDPDDKLFRHTDEDGNQIGEPYSYNDWLKLIESMSGVSQDLLGNDSFEEG